MGIFLDRSIENKLRTKGVAKVNLCSESVIHALETEFKLLHPERTEAMTDGYYFSVFASSNEYRKRLADRLLPILKPSIDAVFQDYKVLAVIAQIKGVGKNSSVGIHQDLTMVDESSFSSFSLWVPLQASTLENGALAFLEGSHQSFRGPRSHNLDYVFGNVEKFVRDNSTTYLSQSGEALVFDNATIHYSSANYTEQPRLSIAISIVDKSAETQLFHLDRKKPFDGKLDRYLVPENFWYLYTNFEKERVLPPSFGRKVDGVAGAQILPYKLEDFERKYKLASNGAAELEQLTMSTPVLKDSNFQEQLDKEGLVVMEFLSDSELKRLIALFEELHTGRSDIPYDRLYTCQHNSDSDYRLRMNREMHDILFPALENHFNHFKNTVFTFQIKGLGNDSELGVHQDWSFAREEEGYRTYTFWIPLVDSDISNGTLSVLRGSHITANGIRGAGIEPCIEGLESDLIPFLEPLTIKAGQLALFDSALIHYSGPNFSSAIRVSAMTNIIPSLADVYLYFKCKDDSSFIEEYLVPDDFFLHYRDFKDEYETPPDFGILTRVIPQAQKEIELQNLVNSDIQALHQAK